MQVASGAAFVGTGSCSGVVTMAAGSTLAPGIGGVGTLTTGGLNLAASTTLAFDLGTSSDQLACRSTTSLNSVIRSMAYDLRLCSAFLAETMHERPVRLAGMLNIADSDVLHHRRQEKQTRYQGTRRSGGGDSSH